MTEHRCKKCNGITEKCEDCFNKIKTNNKPLSEKMRYDIDEKDVKQKISDFINELKGKFCVCGNYPRNSNLICVFCREIDQLNKKHFGEWK